MVFSRKKSFWRPCVVPRDKDVIFRMRASLLYRPAMALCSKLKLGSYFCFDKSNYRKAASSNTSRLEAHAGFFRLLIKRIFDPYVL